MYNTMPENKNQEISAIFTQKIRAKLRSFDLLSFLQGRYDLQKVKTAGGSITFVCPWHADKKPSAWIKNDANGIQRVHCSSSDCQLKEVGGQDALGVLTTLEGINFKNACQTLFGNEFFDDNYHVKPTVKPTVVTGKKPDKEKSTPYVDINEIIENLNTEAISDTLEKFLEEKGFDNYVVQAASILREACYGTYTNPKNKIENLAFVMLDDTGKIHSLHLRNLPGRPKFKGFLAGDGKGKGFFFFDRKSEIVFIVEGIFKASALSCLDYSTICTYGTANVDYCLEIAKELCTDKRIILLLDRGAEKAQKEAMEKHGIEGIFWDKARPQNFGVDDLLAENPETFASVIASYIAHLPKQVKNPNEALSTQVKEKEFLLVIAGTGTGKTESVLNYYKQNDSITVFTNTVNNASDLHKNSGKCGNLVTANSKKEGEQNEEESPLKVGAKNVTTNGYLGLKENFPFIYPIAGYRYSIHGKESLKPGLTINRVLIVDEIHSLIEGCKFVYPLCQAYVLEKIDEKRGRWRKLDGDCQRLQKTNFCFWPARDKRNFNKFVYPLERYDCDATTIFENPEKAIPEIGKVRELQEPERYTQITGTLFGIELPENISKDIPIEDKGKKNPVYTEFDYLKAVLNFTLAPKIICEFPIYRDTQKPISKEELEKLRADFEDVEKAKIEGTEKSLDTLNARVKKAIDKIVQFPKNPAYVPSLSGYNILPLIQVMENSSKVIGLTATITPEQIAILEKVIKLSQWQFKTVKCQEVPFKFNLTVLSHADSLSIAKISKVLAKTLEMPEKQPSLTIVWKKGNSAFLSELLAKECPGCFVEWSERTFKNMKVSIEASDEAKEKLKSIVTYSGSSLLTGSNLPEYNLAIINLGQYISNASLNLPLNATVEKKTELLHSHIQNALRQEIGRLLRVTQEDWKLYKGQTLIAEKQIVALFYNQPDGFKFSPDFSIINDFKLIEASDKFSWYSTLPQTELASIVEAIENCHTKKEVTNWKLLDAQELAKNKASKNSITLKQRNNPLWKEEKEKLKQEQKLLEQAQELNRKFYSWREIVQNLHLSRYPEIKERIRQALQL